MVKIYIDYQVGNNTDRVTSMRNIYRSYRHILQNIVINIQNNTIIWKIYIRIGYKILDYNLIDKYNR
jgi:hypothetical protein